jgi:NAD(P)-dependent dehydrogenase (short-subunit alcohol dehydrogenase family)
MGARSEIGRATALAQRGAAVTVVGRREHKGAEGVAKITAGSGRALAVAGDVSKPDDVERAMAPIVEEFGVNLGSWAHRLLTQCSPV